MLDKLYRSLNESVMLGIQINSEHGKKFYIALVEKIIEDGNITSVYLQPNDISGNHIPDNPISFDSINVVRVYEQLKGHLNATPGANT